MYCKYRGALDKGSSLTIFVHYYVEVASTTYMNLATTRKLMSHIVYTPTSAIFEGHMKVTFAVGVPRDSLLSFTAILGLSEHAAGADDLPRLFLERSRPSDELPVHVETARMCRARAMGSEFVRTGKWRSDLSSVGPQVLEGAEQRHPPLLKRQPVAFHLSKHRLREFNLHLLAPTVVIAVILTGMESFSESQHLASHWFALVHSLYLS